MTMFNVYCVSFVVDFVATVSIVVYVYNTTVFKVKYSYVYSLLSRGVVCVVDDAVAAVVLPAILKHLNKTYIPYIETIGVCYTVELFGVTMVFTVLMLLLLLLLVLLNYIFLLNSFMYFTNSFSVLSIASDVCFIVMSCVLLFCCFVCICYCCC